MKKFLMLAGSLLLIILYLYWGNHAVTTTHYHYSHPDIPEAFDGYTIVQISDLHNMAYDDLPDRVAEEQPEIIVVTGDLIDRNRTDIPIAVSFMDEMMDIAPVYFVSGNHEVASKKYNDLMNELDQIGVQILDDSYTVLEEDGEPIGLLGLADPLLIQEDELDEAGTGDNILRTRLNRLKNDAGTDFTILLSHRPERFDIYVEAGIDLALTGHAHGGQIRLPFIGGLYAPTQGFFPDYTEGMYEKDGTSMLVNRGLGNSIFPFRILNRPEIVAITLQAE